jgi:hypothetical protein
MPFVVLQLLTKLAELFIIEFCEQIGALTQNLINKIRLFSMW